MTVPNVFISDRPGTLRAWLRLLTAYRLPLAILVIATAITATFMIFLFTARASCIELQHVLQRTAAAFELSYPENRSVTAFAIACRVTGAELNQLVIAVTYSVLPCCVLFALFYWSFYRAVFTPPGFVDLAGIWRGVPRVDPHRQSQLYATWVAGQRVLQQTHEQRKAFLAYQRAWREQQYARYHDAPKERACRSEPPEASPAPRVVTHHHHDAENNVPATPTTAPPLSTDAASALPLSPPSPVLSFQAPSGALPGVGVTPHSQAATLGMHSDEVSNPHSVDEYEGNGAVRACTHCSLYKPDHGHHCRLCGRCVFYMDHHCGFLNNCVGVLNYKFFCLLLFYTLCCGAVNGLCILHLIRRARRVCALLRHILLSHRGLAFQLLSPEGADDGLSLSGRIASHKAMLGSAWWLLVPCTMLLLATAVTYLLAFHLELCWRGESTLERKKSASVEALVRLSAGPHTASWGGCSCVCRRARAFWSLITRAWTGPRLRRTSAPAQSEHTTFSVASDTGHDEAERCVPTSEFTDPDVIRASRRRSRFAVLFGDVKPLWVHFVPIMPSHLSSLEWLAREGVEVPPAHLFNTRGTSQKSV